MVVVVVLRLVALLSEPLTAVANLVDEPAAAAAPHAARRLA